MGNQGATTWEDATIRPVTNWLSDADVKEMRELGANGATQAELAEKFHYSVSAVSLILRGRRRKKAGGLLMPDNRHRDNIGNHTEEGNLNDVP